MTPGVLAGSVAPCQGRDADALAPLDLGAGLDDAVMIGDSAADVGAARAAGVPVILVPDGYTGVPAASLGADYVVGSLAEVPTCLNPSAPLRRSA